MTDFQAVVSAFVGVGVIGILIVALVSLGMAVAPSQKQHDEARGFAAFFLFVGLVAGLILLVSAWPFWVLVGLGVIALLVVILAAGALVSEREKV